MLFVSEILIKADEWYDDGAYAAGGWIGHSG